MYELMTSAVFNQKLATAGHSQIETNKLFQEVLFDAFHQAMPRSEGGHGSCQRLTAIVRMAEHAKGINVRKIQAFIQAHADVKWSKNNNGTSSFSFRDKPAVTLPTKTWYEWEHPSDKAKVDVDVVKEIKRLLTKASKEGVKVKDDKGILSGLQDFAIKNGIQWQHTEKKAAAGKHSKHRQPA